jgi:hypothetical protein
MDITTPADLAASGFTRTYTYGESLAPGDPVYVSGSATVSKADANAAGKYPVIGLALETASSGSHSVLLYGVFRNDAYTWTPNAVIYLSATGTLTATPPATSGDVVQVLGTAEHADRVLFNPSVDLAVVS